MKQVRGTLEAYGASIQKDGGMRYSFIRIKQDDGRVVNISDPIAYKNVESQLTYVLAQDDRQITLYYKSVGKKLYAIEYDGHVYSDAGHFKKNWIGGLALGIIIPVVLFMMFTGGKEAATAALIASLFFIPIAGAAWYQAFAYWPSSSARRLNETAAGRHLVSG